LISLNKWESSILLLMKTFVTVLKSMVTIVERLVQMSTLMTRNTRIGLFVGNDIRYHIMRKANRKPLIICIVGESGSGKTTIAEYIEREHGIKMMESYTDRPMRYPGETGHTFVTKEGV